MTVLEEWHHHAEKIHDLEEKQVRQFFVQLHEELWVKNWLDKSGMEIEIPSQTRSGQNSLVMLCRGMNHWTKYLFQSRNTSTSAKIWLQKEQLKIRTLSCRMWQPCTEETRATSRVRVQKKQYATLNGQFPSEKKKWEIVLEFKGHHTPLNTAISMFAMILRHCDQEERDSDGAMHWDLIRSSLLEEFGSRVGQNYYHQDWLQAIHEGSNKTRFEYCKNFLRFKWSMPVQFKDTWYHQNWWDTWKIRMTGRSFCSRWCVPIIWALHWTEGSQLAEMKRKVEDKQFSSHRSTFLGEILTAELEANPSLYPEKHIVAISGKIIKIQCIG